jgi:hypothetical protein
MKTMVKLAVLLATLLLLTGVAFAIPPCECYELSYNFLDDPGLIVIQVPWLIKICFDGDNEGTIYGLCSYICDPGDPFFLFFDSMNEQALTYHTNLGTCVAYLKFHGDDQHVINIISYIESISSAYRMTFRALKTDMSYCDQRCR